jgi:hypothetical protein
MTTSFRGRVHPAGGAWKIPIETGLDDGRASHARFAVDCAAGPNDDLWARRKGHQKSSKVIESHQRVSVRRRKNFASPQIIRMLHKPARSSGVKPVQNALAKLSRNFSLAAGQADPAGTETS